MKYLALASLALWSFVTTAAHAGDASRIAPVGFSANGSYYAFVEYGTGDGSGLPYAKGFVVDVKKNAFVKTAVVPLESVPTEAGAIKKAIAGLNLKTYGITAGAILGETLLSRPLTDKSQYTSTTFINGPFPEGGAGPTYRRYDILVAETPTPAAADAFCDAFGGQGNNLVKVTLKGEDFQGSGVLEAVLQDDKTLPKSRECASEYKVSQVILNGESLVVFLRYSRPGFEGPDHRHLVVTAKQTL